MPSCNAFNNHMCITVAGSWRPCCRFNGFPHVDITKTSFTEYQQSDFYQGVVNNMTTFRMLILQKQVLLNINKVIFIKVLLII